MKLWLTISLSAFAGAGPLPAQIVTDGTMGAAGALSGPNFAVPDSLGQTRGNNLFHSFSQFNVAGGEAANFTGPANIRNVLARVTGGSASTIDGALNCDIAGANLFFINPFGVIFGANAQINVSGSFVATTADYVKLADGGRFDARAPVNDILTTAPVAAFGFLGPTVNDVQVAGPGGEFAPPMLAEIAEGQTFALVGGDVEFHNRRVDAPGGRVALLGVMAAGELAWDVTDLADVPDLTGFATLGDVTFADVTEFRLDGGVGGAFLAIGQNVIADTALYVTQTTTDDAVGLASFLRARDRLELRGGLSWFANDGSHGGDLTLAGREILLTGDATSGGVGLSIGVSNQGEGSSGNLFINGQHVQIADGAVVLTSNSGGGRAGDVVIEALTLTVDGFDIIAVVGTDTFAGDAGNVVITADQVRFRNAAQGTGVNYGFGAGGAFNIHCDTLEITRGSFLSINANGTGNGGSVNITARAVQITGAPEYSQTGIFATTDSYKDPPAAGGTITIQTDTLCLATYAQISSASFGPGDAGQIQITGGDISLTDFAQISSRAFGAGRAGSVLLSATRDIHLATESQITAAAFRSSGGNISLTAGRAIRLADSAITAQAQNDGGNVTLTAPLLIYLLDSTISAASVAGNGGNVIIDPIFVVLQNSQLLANAITGNGGNINITTQYFLSNASLVDASSEFGLAGSVTINAPRLDLTEAIPTLLAELLDVEAQLQPHCLTRLPAHISTFITTGRGATPYRPDDLQPTTTDLP